MFFSVRRHLKCINVGVMAYSIYSFHDTPRQWTNALNSNPRGLVHINVDKISHDTATVTSTVAVANHATHISSLRGHVTFTKTYDKPKYVSFFTKKGINKKNIYFLGKMSSKKSTPSLREAAKKEGGGLKGQPLRKKRNFF